MMNIIIVIYSFFREDQNRPKDHLIWTSRSWFLNLFIYSCILDWVGPKHMYNWTGRPQHQVDPHEIL